MTYPGPLPATVLRFRPLPDRFGTGWQIVVSYPSGPSEYVEGFSDQTKALQWIGSPDCLAWVKARGYQ